MQLIASVSAAACALATLVMADCTADGNSGVPNVAHWHSQDDTDRTIHCVGQFDQPEVPQFEVLAGQTVNNTFPAGWIGNCFAVTKGQPYAPGMLAEFRWNGWKCLNFFDVSAIVNPQDTNGVKEMWPLSTQTPTSGCESFLCDNCYILPDDLQTKSTLENQIVVTLGSKASGQDSGASSNNHKRFHRQRQQVHGERSAEAHPVFPRSYITGEAWEI